MTFARAAWYMTGWADDLTDKPRAVTVLHKPVVTVRGADGTVGVLADICPHRAVPLSMGAVAGDDIVCPHHGLEFDRGGVCRKNPHVQGAPDRLRARACPVAERDGFVWVGMGEEADADPDLIPDYGWFDAPDRFATGRGYLHIGADYRMVIDDLMDLAHSARSTGPARRCATSPRATRARRWCAAESSSSPSGNRRRHPTGSLRQSRSRRSDAGRPFPSFSARPCPCALSLKPGASGHFPFPGDPS